MIFNINYINFFRRLIPYFLRGDDTLSLFNTCAKPLQDINGELVAFRDDISFKMAFNAQIIYLEKYLNTVYPNGLTYPNNIHIIDGANIEFDYLYNYDEAQIPIYLRNYNEAGSLKYLSNNTEQTSNVFSFIVKVPLSVQNGVDWNGNAFNETILRSQINYYNIAGKTYNVEYF